MKIYIAGPYTAGTPEAVLDNVHAAIDAGLALIERGHTPFIPHLTHWVEKRAIRTTGAGLPYEFWMAYDRIWLAHCDAVLFLAPSPGACREAAWAITQNMPIFMALEDVPVEGPGLGPLVPPLVRDAAGAPRAASPPDLVALPSTTVKVLLAAARADAYARVVRRRGAWRALDVDREYQALCMAIELTKDALGPPPEESAR